jgi:hypothetical protein
MSRGFVVGYGCPDGGMTTDGETEFDAERYFDRHKTKRANRRFNRGNRRDRRDYDDYDND